CPILSATQCAHGSLLDFFYHVYVPMLDSMFIIPHHPRSTLFPYTTLFRSDQMPAGSDAPESQIEFLVSEGFAEGSANPSDTRNRSEEHTSELQSRFDLVCRLLLEKK